MPNQSEKKIDPLIPEMVFVEGGSFQMGSDRYDEEQPVHPVRVPDFYLGKHRVTNAQFTAFLNAYGSDRVKAGAHQGETLIFENEWTFKKRAGSWEVATPGMEDHPVVYVNWYTAVTYCAWLSEKTGESYRLPTEAQWEYAARGGRKSRNFQYAESNKLKDVDRMQQTKPVGLEQSNELGLYDRSGRVWEWCADHWHDNYEGAPTDGSAWVEGGESDFRVIRGGSWFHSVLSNRVSGRSRSHIDYGVTNISFRVARY